MGKATDKNYLGIYISPKEICIAQVKIGKDSKPEPEHLVKFPTGFPVKEGMLRPLSLNSDFFSEKAAWITPFKQAIKQVGWSTKEVVVTLSPQFAILRYFVMPSIERRFWNKSIPLESKKYIPVSFEEVSYDFNAVPADGGKKLGVLFGLTQRKSVEFIRETLKAAGLNLAAIEINSASMERLFGFADQKDHDAKGYVHFSESSTLLLFSHGGFPVLYRETEGDSSGTMSERRRLDIKGAIQFVDRYVGGKDYKFIALSGDGAEAWKAAAEKESAPTPVAVWDVAAAVSIKDNDSASLFAMGAALRDRVPGKLLLDISGISTAIELEKQVQGYVWNMTFILGGFLLLLSLVAEVRLLMMGSEISSLNSKVAGFPELGGMDPDSIKRKIDGLQTNARLLSTLVSDTDVLAPKLAAVADAIPPDLWLTDMRYTNPLSVSEAGGAGKELILTGETGLKGEGKIAVVNNFAKALKVAEDFKVFAPPRGAIDSTTEDGSSAVSPVGMPGQLAVGPKSSGFTVMCTVKRR
ncbi:MAG: pilus assembly protein PilM [Elusimicrobiales bacterium]